MDPDLALSPYPLSDRRDPDDEVREIFERLRHTTYLNPTVEDFLEDPRQKDLFLEVFARQANLIKSRCQSFDDCHVTVYDKVLLLLTENGNIFESAAAQEYFCEEFLGINKDGNPIEVNEILQQNVVLKAILAKAAYPQGKYGEKYSAETKYGDKGQHKEDASTPGTKEDDMDERIARLISIYEKAKSDFKAVPDDETDAKMEAARFLRDTAENTVMYFRDPTKTSTTHSASRNMEEIINDLEATCKAAQASVVSLTGGRKRKFDKHDYEVLPRGARGGYRGRSFRRGYSSSDRGRGRGTGNYSNKKWHTSDRDVRRNADLFPDYHSSPRDHPTGYGYTRPVDSYHPESDPAPVSTHAHPYEQQQQQHHLAGAYDYEGISQQYQDPGGYASQYGYGGGAEQQAYEGYAYDNRYGQGSGRGRGQQHRQQSYRSAGPRPEGDRFADAAAGRGGHHYEYGHPNPRVVDRYHVRRGGGAGRGDGNEYQPEMGY